MGFHEDDRIRYKNAAHSQAYELYTSMQERLMSNSDIMAEAERRMIASPGDKVAYELFKMALRAGIPVCNQNS